MNFNLQPVRYKTHHAGRFHPWDLIQLGFLLGQWDKEDVATNIGAHHFHDLSLGHVLHAHDFDVVARFDAKPPGALAIVIERRRGQSRNAK